MPFVPIPTGTDCQVRYTHGTNRYENGFGYKWSGSPPTAAELLALATEVGQTIGNKMASFMHVGVVMREVYCRNVHTADAEQATYVFPVNTLGQRTAGPVASNEACGVTKRTGLTGRKRRGRNSFSEFTEGDVDGNTIGSAILNLISNLILSIIAQRVGGRFVPAVLSKAGPFATPINSAIVLDSNVDSQKTRLNQHGT